MTRVTITLLKCDRCGKTRKVRKGAGWGFEEGVGDICPECMRGYHKLLKELSNNLDQKKRE